MNSEQRKCQNCHQQFVIEADDFAFYERMQVPFPTFCWECSLKHKMGWGICFMLKKRTCDAPGHEEQIFSRFGDEKVTVYDHQFWWSDKWDAPSFGREYDFNRPFFEQLKELYIAVPLPNLMIVNSINCEYCPSAQDCKDCYLIVGGFGSQECMYSITPVLSQRVVDSNISLACDTLYDCYACTKSFNLKYSVQCNDCLDSAFLYECRGCSDCFGCVGLRNKQYHIFNKPYTKEEYKKEMAKIDLGSRAVVWEYQKRFEKHLLAFPRKYADIKNSVNSTGHDILNAKNCKNCFQTRDDIEDCSKVVLAARGVKESRDVWGGGLHSQLLYNCCQITGGQRIMFSSQIRNSHDVQYSRECFSSSNLFGCAGLRDKKYAILNKLYSKEDYEKMLPRIIEHMQAMPYRDSRGKTYQYGDFLPFEFSSFRYNESSLQEYFPLTREQALHEGFRWKDREEREYSPTMHASEMPDSIKDVSDSVLKDIIECAHQGSCLHQCTAAFRITPQELQFYRNYNIPLPSICPSCRATERTKWRLPFKLWHRQCRCNSRDDSIAKYQNTREHFHADRPCPNEFETPYQFDRPELLYCEECYNSEIL